MVSAGFHFSLEIAWSVSPSTGSHPGKGCAIDAVCTLQPVHGTTISPVGAIVEASRIGLGAAMPPNYLGIGRLVRCLLTEHGKTVVGIAQPRYCMRYSIANPI